MKRLALSALLVVFAITAGCRGDEAASPELEMVGAGPRR